MTLIQILDKFVDKIMSGRWLLTAVIAFVILRTCWNDTTVVHEYKEIFLVVIYAYFERRDRAKNDNSQNNG